jgi:hypothetical protein
MDITTQGEMHIDEAKLALQAGVICGPPLNANQAPRNSISKRRKGAGHPLGWRNRNVYWTFRDETNMPAEGAHTVINCVHLEAVLRPTPGQPAGSLVVSPPNSPRNNHHQTSLPLQISLPMLHLQRFVHSSK